MEILTALTRVVPFAAASGINLYATVAVLGLGGRYELFELPEQFATLEHPLVITVALLLFLAEFVADKIPWFDSVWDAIHTVIRPIGGAAIAVAALGDSSSTMAGLAALVGGGVALTTHLTKAGTRAVANTSPEPLSNWTLSLIEDAFVIGLTYVAVQHPYLALTVALLLLAVIGTFAAVLVRALRRRYAAWTRSAMSAS
jgi:hypothetical protein